MEVLVMGGTEFVSQSVAEHFIRKNYNVSILTRGRTSVSVEGIKHHFKCDRKIETELEQLESYKFDYIIDINAYTKNDVELLLNHINTENLKRYVFCSTGGVYLHSFNAISEDYDKGLNSLVGDYGTDKLEAEQYLLDKFTGEGLPVSIFRPPYIYGKYNGIYREGYFFDAINDEKAIPIPVGSNQVTFIHTDDLVKFIESLLTNDNAIGEAYNINYDESLTFSEVVSVFETLLEKKANTFIVDSKEYNPKSYFPYIDMPYVLSVKKLKEHGLYIPKLNLLDGLTKTYTWYKFKKPENLRQNMTQLSEVISKFSK